MTTTWTPADEDRKLNEYRRFYARQTDAEILRIHAVAAAFTNPGRDERRSLKGGGRGDRAAGPPVTRDEIATEVARLRDDAAEREETAHNMGAAGSFGRRYWVGRRDAYDLVLSLLRGESSG